MAVADQHIFEYKKKMNRTTAPVFGGLCVCSVGGRTWRQVPVPGNRPLGKREKKKKKERNKTLHIPKVCLLVCRLCEYVFVCVCTLDVYTIYLDADNCILYTKQLLVHFLLGPNSCDPPLFLSHFVVVAFVWYALLSRRRWVVHSYENVGPLIFFFSLPFCTAVRGDSEYEPMNGMNEWN